MMLRDVAQEACRQGADTDGLAAAHLSHCNSLAATHPIVEDVQHERDEQCEGHAPRGARCSVAVGRLALAVRSWTQPCHVSYVVMSQLESKEASFTIVFHDHDGCKYFEAAVFHVRAGCRKTDAQTSHHAELRAEAQLEGDV